jgi:predicted transcriptional regulator
MYKANLAWQELKKDLSALQAQGIIEPEAHKEGIFYHITATGRDALEHFNQVASLLATTVHEEAAPL